ncbi:alkyl sulfatase C-terminal domain-containing protein [Streptomyces klenkii]|uniref:alkyl sulfatase C-terminal domain-containing protein n=1 Tax=Streptomyces klenkii TaxID=1420899 RepID=UPI001F542CD0|nr:alkyl sulfatase C-terminal domain-containing protein [Streptomyces klenkii]
MNGPQRASDHGAADLVRSMTLDLFFQAMAKSIDGPRAAQEQTTPIVLRWVLDEPRQECTTTLRNGVLIYVEGPDALAGKPTATITLTREALNNLALAGHRFTQNFDDQVAAGTIQVDDEAAADTVFSYLVFPDPRFPIVTPRKTVK